MLLSPNRLVASGGPLLLALLASCGSCARSKSLGPGVRVVTGESFTCVRLATGKVRCCGQGWEGELGNDAYEDEGHLVDAKSELRCEGADDHGQLCDGASPPRSSTFPPPP